MTCLKSEDGKMYVCGGLRRRSCHYFDKTRRYVLFCDSLWYGPNLVSKLKRKKFGRIDLFEARVVKKLGFLPRTYRGWWQFVAVPQLKDLKEKKA